MLFVIVIGFMNGARTFTPPAVIAWGAALGMLQVEDSRVAFLASSATATLLTALALMELVADKQPGMPSRRSPAALTARLLAGTLCGAALGAHLGVPLPAAALGAAAAGIGTFVTYAMRAGLARAFGRDLPAALIEDAVVVTASVAVVAVGS